MLVRELRAIPGLDNFTTGMLRTVNIRRELREIIQMANHLRRKAEALLDNN